MNPWASFLIAVSIPTSLFAKERVVLKYDELPKLIQNSSLDLKAAGLLMEATSARQGSARRASYPRLDLESGLRGVRELDGSGDNAPFFKVEGSVNLYRGGRDALMDSLQEKETAIRKEEAQLVFKNQLLLAREIFVKLASVRALKKAWTDAMKVVETKKKSSRMKFNAGLTTKTDLLEFELHESSLKREKRNLDKDEHELSNKMLILLGLSEDVEISLDRVFSHPPEPKEAAYRLAAESHPLVRKLALQADQAQLMARSKPSRWTPEINFFAAYEQFLEGDRDVPGALPKRDFTAGLRASILLGDNLSLKNEAFAKGLEASAYGLQKQQSARQVEAHHHEFLHDMHVLHELIHDSESQLQKAERFLKLTSEEYERGLKNGPDVLEASRTLYTTQVENIQLIFDYYLAEAGISSLIAE